MKEWWRNKRERRGKKSDRRRRKEAREEQNTYGENHGDDGAAKISSLVSFEALVRTRKKESKNKK
jgi:hypothetical protein